MIKSIYMSNCATYSAEGEKIEDCKKINFFYGPNGSGKSTISNYLYNSVDSKYNSCTIEWENDNPMDTLVYNKEFRARHFKENIAGVFTLGADAIEDIEALEKMKTDYENKYADSEIRKRTLKGKNEERQALDTRFKENVWSNIFKKNDSDFQVAFSGLRSSREKFKEEVINKYNISHQSAETRESIIERSKLLFSEKPELCNPINTNDTSLTERLDIIENDPIWSKTIVGNKDVPIAKLIGFLNNADWVNKGRSYIGEDGVCPFCQQKTITKDLENQLNDFFYVVYENDIEYINELVTEYRSISEQLQSKYMAIVNDEHTTNIANIDTVKANALLDSLKSSFSTVIVEMESKTREPGSCIEISKSKQAIENILKVFNSANEVINKHNTIVDNFNDEKQKLVDDIWEFLVTENSSLIKDYLKDVANIDKAIKGIATIISDCQIKLNELNEKIVEAGKNITSVQPTVDEINRSLRAYGFTNFQIVPSKQMDNCYQIQRMDGTLATNTLSEGEETFISFLYFMQLAKGSMDETKVSSSKVLVLDDPISSLDSTVLYIVSSMVKSLVKDVRENKSNVKQVFVLTHNVFFHKEASFINGRTKECNDVNYWIISKDYNVTSIRSFGKENPIKTSYELLWKELKTNTNASLVTTQNIMRRIIENYFGILGKEIDDTIVESFDSVEDKTICRSLISWINDGSHSIPDDFYIDSYTDSIDRYKRVFRELFVNMKHEEHYKMMMEEE